jgi:hypothetical protein
MQRKSEELNITYVMLIRLLELAHHSFAPWFLIRHATSSMWASQPMTVLLNLAWVQAVGFPAGNLLSPKQRQLEPALAHRPCSLCPAPHSSPTTTRPNYP